MCIRDRCEFHFPLEEGWRRKVSPFLGRSTQRAMEAAHDSCLLYTSDAADERSSVDLGGRRIIKKTKPYIYIYDISILFLDSMRLSLQQSSYPHTHQKGYHMTM